MVESFIHSFKVGSTKDPGLEISHLLFVDDTSLLYDVNGEQLSYFGYKLCFRAIYG